MLLITTNLNHHFMIMNDFMTDWDCDLKSEIATLTWSGGLETLFNQFIKLV